MAKGIKVEDSGHPCPRCGCKHTVKHGFNVTKRGRFQRFKCMECGSTFY